ncbi:MAG: DUF3098 domain-containing protein [Bacteroidales bacterium]|nr:DUF3098 domain-containing protein [Bacteroidales bacterium]
MEEKNGFFALPKKILVWMIAGFAVMVLGYLLLCGGASGDPSRFSPEIFSFRRLVIAPIVIIAGAVAITIAIIKIKK